MSDEARRARARQAGLRRATRRRAARADRQVRLPPPAATRSATGSSGWTICSSAWRCGCATFAGGGARAARVGAQPLRTPRVVAHAGRAQARPRNAGRAAHRRRGRRPCTPRASGSPATSDRLRALLAALGAGTGLLPCAIARRYSAPGRDPASRGRPGHGRVRARRSRRQGGSGAEGRYRREWTMPANKKQPAAKSPVILTGRPAGGPAGKPVGGRPGRRGRNQRSRKRSSASETIVEELGDRERFRSISRWLATRRACGSRGA